MGKWKNKSEWMENKAACEPLVLQAAYKHLLIVS